MSESSKIPIYKMRLPITGSEAILNVCGDFHYGVKDVEKNNIINALNSVADKYKDNIFRVYTGDLVENALKTSVGHNYDVPIPDPADQKKGMIQILNATNKHLYGVKNWSGVKIDKTTKTFDGVKSICVEGNHEYRSRKLTGQWLGEEMCDASKTLWLGMQALIDLTIYNKRLKMEKTYKLFVAHRPSKTDATSSESILRAFRKKQSSLPGVDVIAFGHFHKRFLQAGGYFDCKSNDFKKVLYVINPSPMGSAEYAEEAGYPPLELGYYINVHLPLDPCAQIWGTI